MNQHLQFISLLEKSLIDNIFVKVSLANYKGEIQELKNCYMKKTQIKGEDKLSVTYRYKTKDIVKNIDLDEGTELIASFIEKGDFRHASLFTINNDILFEYLNANKIILRKKEPTHKVLPSLEHNIKKNRLLSAIDKSYLYQLKITDEKGIVIPSAQDKYKQINHYVELLNPLIKNLPHYDLLNVVDMGSGKGYLTFALYDYLSTVLKLRANVTGVEYRKDLVDLCNDIAVKSNFSGLNFNEGTIMNYDASKANVLIALHACNTATDDAIYKGIHANADLIVVAPCCHKQIRREIEKNKTKNELDFLLKHGIFLERQAEMVTDGIRSLILEYFGYTTKVFQFIAETHTPKNVMIVAEKKAKTENKKQDILDKIKETKSFFGISNHYLEKIMGL